MPPPDPSHATCALCRRAHDPDSPCSVVAGEQAGRIGETLGDRYELVRLLGAGGMGVVYEARHKLIGRRCAVKLLHPQYAQQAAMLTRFQREARAAGSLENEHIAAVTDFGFAGDGAPYLVMERLEGQDLAALLERVGPLPVGRAVALVAQACRGLAAAHASDIVHRDLKPANLFLTRRSDGSDLVKVLDFGIAKLLDADETGTSITATGKLLGTACYMPPEQAKGDPDLDQRSDIYALGAILYELLTGIKVHAGTNYNAVLFQILTQSCRPVRELRPDLPASLCEVIERAMAFERRDRYPSVTELHEALLPYASAPGSGPLQMSPEARAAMARMATVVTPPTAEPSPARVPPGPPPAPIVGRRRRARVAALAVVAVAAVAGIGWLARPQPAPVPAPLPTPHSPAAPQSPTAAPEPAVLPPPAPRIEIAPEPKEPVPLAPPRHKAPRAKKPPAAGGDGFDTRNPYND